MCCNFKRKTEAQAIFLNPFTVCSSRKRKFAICQIVHEETKGKLSVCKRPKGTRQMYQSLIIIKTVFAIIRCWENTMQHKKLELRETY